ncbi:isochorismatase family protein [Methylocystis bryophila]|uniref:nicotinamidase n=1 Tax=Methylocystis bryophila TaxID=655015 RepID=A0A1W6MSR9_9HYPH|nr:isochorismatase family protein [Methylocystis bryophila]ARN80539.1 nicotinamidase [Methylocystis bryophila]BDV40589.1 bifunctional pyrazinamidase/nicotinamidase [Methylocystis bryophila]
MSFGQDDALIVLDLQRDFCAGGALAIAGADKIAPKINQLIDEATAAGAMVVASRDWHPKGHVSFAARGGPWPEHCVAGSEGAKFHAQLCLPDNALIVTKGADLDKDQYSVFDETGLVEQLHGRGTRRVFLCGLALDVCVRASALQAVQAGFETHVMLSATRPITQAGGEATIREMTNAGIVVEHGDPDDTTAGCA